MIRDTVQALSGVGEKKTQLLKKLGIISIEDLLFFAPRTYEDRTNITKIRDITEEGSYLVKGIVSKVIKSRNFNRGKAVLKIVLSDSTGELEAVFFNANYIANGVVVGKEYFFWGRVNDKKMVFPEISSTEMGIVPIYSLTKGLTQKELRKIMKIALDKMDFIEERHPKEVLEINNVCSLDYGIRNIHFPENKETLKAAKYRMLFDELLFFQLGIDMIKTVDYKDKNGVVIKCKDNRFVENLPFCLTEAQNKVIDEINRDLQEAYPMNRLLQGDVGSGKTVIAESAIYQMFNGGFQSTVMVPTEVLATQHFDSMSKSLMPYGIKIELLTGSKTKKQKKEILENLEMGQTDLIIGTHALIEENVKFKNLGLVVTDEQHRFGVAQRTILAEKGGEKLPNILVMTATPIPRTIGVIMYGDLDISIIDKMPENRKPIITTKVQKNDRLLAYKLLEEQIKLGRQGYVVTPLIEDSEVIDAKSAESVFEELRTNLSFVCEKEKIALLHGGMKDHEKLEIMTKFKSEEIKVLVSTVVIEVGINVPNATMMIIESADRFGLSQLHQLRGRVGRGGDQAYCQLIYDKKGEISEKRLDIMVSSTDGFFISEKDVELRGVGDIFGTRQSGFVLNRIIELTKNIKMVERAQKTCEEVLEKDKALQDEKNRYLREGVEKTFGKNIGFFGRL